MLSEPVVYIAAPFFNPEQLHLVKNIEAILAEQHVPYFSPRKFGVLIEMTPVERRERMNEIYHKNIEMIVRCPIMVAVIDDHDVGTMFEIGYATAIKDKLRNIITLSNNDYGLNIMLRNSVDAHLRGCENLAACVNEAITGGSLEVFMSSRGEAW